MTSLFGGFDPSSDSSSDPPEERPDHAEMSAAPWKQEKHPQKSYRPYAGVGSRSTPDEVLETMATVARHLGNSGWTLRSGGADGADFAFDWGAGLSSGYREIYLPTRGWHGKKGPQYHTFPDRALAAAKKAWAPYAERTGVAPWKNLKPLTRKLMARNVCQVCGPRLNRLANFVVCWTPDGACNGEETTPDSGGTGMAIRVASRAGVPVFNLKRKSHLKRVTRKLPEPS